MANQRNSVESAYSTDDPNPGERQSLAKRGRVNSPPLSRAVFYDARHKKAEVRRGKNVGEYPKNSAVQQVMDTIPRRVQTAM